MKNVGPFAVVVVISTVSIRQRSKRNITISRIKNGQIMQGLKLVLKEGAKFEAAQPTRLSSLFAECGCILRETLLLLQYMMKLVFIIASSKASYTPLSTTRCRSSSDESKGDVDPRGRVYRRNERQQGEGKT